MALKRALGPWQYFSFSFGTVVGVGWIVLLGDWLQRGGPAGAIIGFAIGGLLMALIGLCYAEASGMFPVSGGEMAFALEGFGKRAGFATGWALVLVFIAAAAYCGSSLAWIMDYLVPGIRGPTLYSFRGSEIHAGSLAVALGAIGVFTGVNLRGVQTAGRFQDWFTYSKILIALVFIVAGVAGGSTGNLQPLFSTEGGRTPIGGTLAVLALVPWFLGGFNAVPQVMEERAEGVSLKVLGRVTVGSILAGALFYCLVIFSGSMPMPWTEVVTRELPAAAAFKASFNSEWLARLVLITGIFGVSTVGNGSVVAASRTLFAMSRAGLIGPGLSQTHPVTGAPGHAILFVGIIAGLGAMLGRQGIAPIVAVGAIGMSLGYLVTSATVLKFRRAEPDRSRPYKMPLGHVVALVATLGSTALILAALRDPWVSSGGKFPLEWMLMGAWAALGLLFYVRRVKKAA